MTVTKPKIPGTVIGFTGVTQPRILPSFADTVALIVTHDWGPVGTDSPGATGLLGGPQELLQFSEWTGLFGDSDTPGRTAVAGAFAGQGLGRGDGAGAVVVFRLGNGATVATQQFNNTAGSPAAALQLDGKYKGTRGNRISAVIDADPNVTANDRLRLRLDGIVQESYSYPRTDIAGLVASINLVSNLVKATSLVTGTGLAVTAGTTLAGGTDGSAPVANDHLAALTALAYQEFSILAPYDVTDAPTQAVYLTWAQGQSARSRPVMLVVGGAAGETMATAVARAQALADPHVVTLGGGTWHDDLLGKDLSTSQLAPRIAGILSARGREKSLTGAKVAGLHPVGATAPSEDDIAAGLGLGVTALMRIASPDADLRIAKGVTTWWQDTTGDKSAPVKVFGDPRKIRILDIYRRQMRKWGDDFIVGATTVTNATRAQVRGEARRQQDELLEAGLILPGDGVLVPKPFVVVDPPTDPALSDAIAYQFGWAFADTANYVIGEGTVR